MLLLLLPLLATLSHYSRLVLAVGLTLGRLGWLEGQSLGWPSLLLPTEGVVRGDHLSHEHGGGHHNRSARHWSGHELGHQLLPCWEPDLSILREGGHSGAWLRVGRRQAGADLQHVGLPWLGDHHGVVQRSRYRTLGLGLGLGGLLGWTLGLCDGIGLLLLLLKVLLGGRSLLLDCELLIS